LRRAGDLTRLIHKGPDFGLAGVAYSVDLA
jgi:hypothetical protein